MSKTVDGVSCGDFVKVGEQGKEGGKSSGGNVQSGGNQKICSNHIFTAWGKKIDGRLQKKITDTPGAASIQLKSSSMMVWTWYAAFRGLSEGDSCVCPLLFVGPFMPHAAFVNFQRTNKIIYIIYFHGNIAEMFLEVFPDFGIS